MIRVVPTTLFLAALVLWVLAWSSLAKSSLVALLPAWVWVSLMLVSALPLELLYRRARPGPRRERTRGRRRGRYPYGGPR